MVAKKKAWVSRSKPSTDHSTLVGTVRFNDLLTVCFLIAFMSHSLAMTSPITVVLGCRRVDNQSQDQSRNRGSHSKFSQCCRRDLKRDGFKETHACNTERAQAISEYQVLKARERPRAVNPWTVHACSAMNGRSLAFNPWYSDIACGMRHGLSLVLPLLLTLV